MFLRRIVEFFSTASPVLHWKFLTRMSRKICLACVLNNCLYKTGLTSSPACMSVRSASHCRGEKRKLQKCKTFSLIALWGWLVLFYQCKWQLTCFSQFYWQRWTTEIFHMHYCFTDMKKECICIIRDYGRKTHKIATDKDRPAKSNFQWDLLFVWHFISQKHIKVAVRSKASDL